MLLLRVIVFILAVEHFEASPTSQLYGSTTEPGLACEELPSESKIRQYIQRNNYSSSVRPVRDAQRSVEVELAFYLEKINELAEKSQTIIVTGYFGATWLNEFFSWNETQYGCIDQILLPSSESWLPDISLTNSGDLYSLLLTKGHKVQVFNTGVTSFFPATTFKTFCDLDLTYFPLDQQVCYLRFESWVYTIQAQRFALADPPIEKIHWSENEQWRLVDLGASLSNTTYELPDEVFDTITFSITIERKVAYYLFNVILPSVIISFVELVIFLLPTVEVEKIPISFTCLLAYSVFQLMVTGDLPRTSTKTPLLSIYIVLQMSFIGFALVGEGFVFICCWNLERLLPLPPKLYKTCKYLGTIFGLKEQKVDTNKAIIDSQAEAALSRHHHLQFELTEAVSPFGSARSSFNSNQNIPVAGIAAAFSNMAKNLKRSSLEEAKDGDYWPPPPPEEMLRCDQASSHRRHSEIENQTLVRELLQRLKKSRQNSQLRAKWLFIASVIDRTIAIIYFVSILSTPLIMFLIMPMVYKFTM